MEVTPISLGQSDVDMAQNQENALMNESPGILKAQVAHLNERVVMLRAYANALEAQLAELTKSTELGEGVDPAPDVIDMEEAKNSGHKSKAPAKKTASSRRRSGNPAKTS